MKNSQKLLNDLTDINSNEVDNWSQNTQSKTRTANTVIIRRHRKEDIGRHITRKVKGESEKKRITYSYVLPFSKKIICKIKSTIV